MPRKPHCVKKYSSMLGVSWRIIVAITFCLYCSGTAGQGCADDNEFLCGSGECISKVFLCDGSKECVDGSDETLDLCQYRSCSQSIDYVDIDETDIFAVPTLGTGVSFRCNYGACIANQFICDGIRHCVADGSDESEAVCSKRKCQRRQFRCNYGGCVMRLHACDNRYHCWDRSDETPEACKWRNRPCNRRRQFRCANGACIKESKKCNGMIDCLDGSDEIVDVCGPGSATPIPKPNITSIRPTPPPPVLPPISENSGNDPVILPQPSPKPNTENENQPPTIPEDGGKGCRQTDNPETNLEIIVCQDSSGCINQIVPAGTVMVIYCDGNPTPLECKEDDLWHFVRKPLKAPRKYPCEDAGSSTKPIETNTSHRIYTPVPTECGNLPPFSPIPWLVGLFRNGNFACTGTIIGPALILTAGHCITTDQATNTRVIKPGILKVQFQSENPNDPREFTSVSAIEIHPNYKGGDSPRADLALLFLTKNLYETHSLGSACLDSDGKLLLEPAWTFNRTVGQRIYQWDHFQQNFDRSCVNKATICTRHLNIGDNQFCAINEEKPKFLHQGASGGPYLIQKIKDRLRQWTVAGVVSSSIQTTECGTRTVFTYVSRYRNWIINCGFHGNCRI